MVWNEMDMYEVFYNKRSERGWKWGWLISNRKEPIQGIPFLLVFGWLNTVGQSIDLTGQGTVACLMRHGISKILEDDEWVHWNSLETWLICYIKTKFVNVLKIVISKKLRLNV